MKIANLSLPYPVLGVHDDIAGKYEISGPDVTTKPDKTDITLAHVLRSHEIQALIESGKAEFVTHVHCMKSAFRQCFRTSSITQTISIGSDDLRDKVELEFFIIAAQPIADYRPQSAHADYSGFTFDLTPGDVLAYGGSTNFVAHKQWMASEAVGSFMVLEEGDWKTGPMKVILDRDKIAIRLSREDFKRYKSLSLGRQLDRIFHSALVLPALIYAVTQMLNAKEAYEDRKWYHVLEDRRTNDPELMNETWDVGNAPVIAQKLLAGPLDRTLSALVELSGVTESGA